MTVTFADLVYLLCFLTSASCAWLLVRQHLNAPTRILLWSAACFSFLALSNLLVVVDQLVLTEAKLRGARLVLTLLAVSVLLFGFIWDAERD